MLAVGPMCESVESIQFKLSSHICDHLSCTGRTMAQVTVPRAKTLTEADDMCVFATVNWA